MRIAQAVCVIAVVASSLAGCARSEKFEILVRNETKSPLTLALTKDGPPFEPLWAGPEDLAIGSPRADEQHGFVVLPPGREAGVSVEGKFDRGTRGYLRVYRGDLQISDMTAIGPASPNRVDLPLRVGVNRFVIGDARGRLERTVEDQFEGEASPRGPAAATGAPPPPPPPPTGEPTPLTPPADAPAPQQ